MSPRLVITRTDLDAAWAAVPRAGRFSGSADAYRDALARASALEQEFANQQRLALQAEAVGQMIDDLADTMAGTTARRSGKSTLAEQAAMKALHAGLTVVRSGPEGARTERFLGTIEPHDPENP